MRDICGSFVGQGDLQGASSIAPDDKFRDINSGDIILISATNFDSGGATLNEIGIVSPENLSRNPVQIAVGHFLVHAPSSYFPVVNNGELAVLYCFALLYIAAAGGGA